MSDKPYEEMTEEERKQYRVSRYLKLSDQKTALEELVSHIDAAQQGYLNMWATGFTELDRKLDGGFLGGNLIVLGAISSLGKTTFALQIADQIAAQKKDVLIFSLEMSKNELNAKSISRNTFKLTDAGVDRKGERKKTDRQKYRLTMSDILRGRVGGIAFGQGTDEKGKLFYEALAETQKLNDHLFIIRDNDVDLDKITAYIDAHIEAGRQRPFVIIDYLQIIKAREEARTTDKRLLTDDDVNRLKDLAVKRDIPILLISSFNRNSYLEPVSMGSFKESGTIEYSSDTLIALQYSGMQYQKHWYTNNNGTKKKVYESKIEHDTRVRQLAEKMDEDGAAGAFLPIDVVLLKNRGISKGKLLFEFCPKYNVFYEKQNQDAELYAWNKDADESDYDLSNLELPENKKSLGKI